MRCSYSSRLDAIRCFTRLSRSSCCSLMSSSSYSSRRFLPSRSLSPAASRTSRSSSALSLSFRFSRRLATDSSYWESISFCWVAKPSAASRSRCRISISRSPSAALRLEISFSRPPKAASLSAASLSRSSRRSLRVVSDAALSVVSRSRSSSSWLRRSYRSRAERNTSRASRTIRHSASRSAPSGFGSSPIADTSSSFATSMASACVFLMSTSGEETGCSAGAG